MKWLLALIFVGGLIVTAKIFDLVERAGEYWPLFKSAGSLYGVPARLLAAQAMQESGFDPTAKSGAGAEGIMQLEPAFYPSVNPWVPAEAIPAAAHSMAAYRSEFGSWRLALAAYNWGPGNLDSWRKTGLSDNVWPSETQHYVRVVMATAGIV